jgi:F-type H+-transporting ATPase subunit gamma
VSDTQVSLRRKINGATKLKSIVRTMKAVAASSIGQYEAAVRALADYERSVELGLSVCFRQGWSTTAHSSRKKSTRVVGAIVFGSDQGLVGQFNEAIAEFVESKLSASPDAKKIWAVGERIHARLADAGLPLAGKFAVPGSVNAITTLVGQLQMQMASEAPGEDACAEVQVFHTRLTSGAFCQPVCQRLLPLDEQWRKDLSQTHWPTKNLPELFGRDEGTLSAFIREFLFISLFKACAESLASENASRLAAMQRAEKNIDSQLNNLNRTFRRLRQSSIDEELFDVIAGFNALSQKRVAPVPRRA